MQIQLKRMLQGTWKFGFEKGESAGEKSQGLPELNDTIELPSTTEISKKGSFGPKEGQTLFLSRKYPFTGRAHYEREIEIPKEWAGHPIFLFLERTKYTEVYVDGKWVSMPLDLADGERYYLVLACTGEDCKVLGGFNARIKHTFRLSIFLSGTVGNAAIAVFLTWMGPKLGIPLYLAAVVVFGTRMFQNFAEIRRELLTSKQKRDKIEQDIVPPASGDTK